MRSYNYSRVTGYYVFIITCIVPLFFTPFSANDAFREPKYIIWAIAFIATVISIVFERVKSKSHFSLRVREKICVVFFFYVIIWILSTLASVDKMVSITGYPLYNGLVQLFLCVLTFLLLISHYEFELFHMRYILAAYSIVSLYCFIQLYKMDPFVKYYGDNVRKYIGQSFATIGNQNQVAACLCVIFVISAFLYIFGIGSKNEQRMYFMTCILLFVGVIATKSRGGWLAIGVSFFLSLPYVLKLKCIKRYLLLAFLCCIILSTIEITAGGIILNRILSIFAEGINVVKGNLGGDQGSKRIEIWMNSLGLIQKYWIIGSGPDTFFIVYNNLDAKLQTAAIEKNFFLSPHNESLRLLITTGVFSLALYWTFVIIILRRAIRAAAKNRIVIPFLFGLVCYLVKGMFNCSVITDMILFWVLSAVIYRFTMNETQNSCNSCMFFSPDD